MRYLPLTPKDRGAMLSRIGVDSADAKLTEPVDNSGIPPWTATWAASVSSHCRCSAPRGMFPKPLHTELPGSLWHPPRS